MSREECMKHLEFITAIPQYTQKSEDWINQRKGKLTSSDAATALGINPYKHKDELLLEKCGAGRKFFGNVSTFHGEKYEDEAIGKYEMLMGKKNYNYGMISFSDLDPLRASKEHSKKYIDRRYHFLAGSPDGIAIDNHNYEGLCGVEVKCPMRRKIKHGQISEYYYPQVQLNMFILDLELFDFIEYVPDPTEINIVRIHRNTEWFDSNFPILEAFWNEVLEWRQKDITTHPAYKKYYKDEVIHKSLFIETDEDRPTKKSSV
jgi:putative phage-type endonuclease